MSRIHFLHHFIFSCRRLAALHKNRLLKGLGHRLLWVTTDMAEDSAEAAVEVYLNKDETHKWGKLHSNH
eukprot:1974738-Rhodomonas_salina.2